MDWPETESDDTAQVVLDENETHLSPTPYPQTSFILQYRLRTKDFLCQISRYVDYALKVSREAERVDESDYQRLNDFGFDDEDIWDIGPISVFFELSNRIVNMSSMRTNEEFYLMGRIPRES